MAEISKDDMLCAAEQCAFEAMKAQARWRVALDPAETDEEFREYQDAMSRAKRHLQDAFRDGDDFESLTPEGVLDIAAGCRAGII